MKLLGQQDARDLRQGRGAGSTGWGRAAASGCGPVSSQAESPVWAGERVREAREEPFQRGAQGRARSCNVGGRLSAMERRLIPSRRAGLKRTPSAVRQSVLQALVQSVQQERAELTACNVSSTHAVRDRLVPHHGQTYARTTF